MVSDFLGGYLVVIGTPPWGQPGVHCFADLNGNAGLPTRLQKTLIKGKILGAKSEGDVSISVFVALTRYQLGLYKGSTPEQQTQISK